MAAVRIGAAALFTFYALSTVCAYKHGNSDPRASKAQLEVDQNGRYQIKVGGEVWLSSANAFMTLHGKTYSTADGSLKLEKRTMEKGQDVLGAWQSTSYWYSPTGETNYKMVASVYTYTNQSFYIFRQRFPQAVPSEGAGSANSVCTGFPTFALGASNASLGYHAFGGIMFGNTHMKWGKWTPNMTSAPVSGLDSGPLVLFDQGSMAAIVSSFSNFMAGSVAYDTHGKTASWGLLGKAKNIPAGFEYGVIVHFSDQGINKVISEWGDVLRKYYNRHTAARDSDFTNNYLGYYTDNGAYYYYKTEPNKTYDQTLYDVKNYALSQKIPYRYVQYDSWWYKKGPSGGVTEWVSMDSIFPEGMRTVWNKTGWMSVAHNRWWSYKTTYAKQNGGKYDFIIEPSTHKALPIDQVFWDDLFRTAQQWGLYTYEQDWLNWQFDEMQATVSDVELGRLWLRQMGRGASLNGIFLQYCMAPSRHALQSLEVPAVSQARVTTDYHLSPDQWQIGISSMFAHAMGVAPFKDNFWTTSVQPGNPYHKKEPYPALEAVVATLSTGPVAPGDRNGYSNASLIMRSCDISGRLLKPARPAFAIDDQIKMAAAGHPLGEIWATYSSVSGLNFGIILAAGIKATYDLGPTKAGLSSELPVSRIFAYTSPTSVNKFSDAEPLHLTPSCTHSAFCLYHTTPVLTWQGQELLLLGEVNKWVPMSSQRVKSISISTDDVNIELEGSNGEQVDFHLLYGGKSMVVSCTCGRAGLARISLKNKMCS